MTFEIRSLMKWIDRTATATATATVTATVAAASRRVAAPAPRPELSLAVHWFDRHLFERDARAESFGP